MCVYNQSKCEKRKRPSIASWLKIIEDDNPFFFISFFFELLLCSSNVNLQDRMNIRLNTHIYVKWLSMWRDQLVISKKLIVQMRCWWKIILNLTWCVRFLLLFCLMMWSIVQCRIRPNRWCADVCIYIYIDIYMLVFVRPEDKTLLYSLLNIWFILVIHVLWRTIGENSFRPSYWN